MTRLLSLAAIALTLSAAMPAYAQKGRSPIIGAWRMTSLQVGTEGNLKPIRYSGQVIFSEGGTLSVQAMNPDAGAADTPYTTKAYEAYYGPVKIDDRARTFTITVESSLVRDLIGQSLNRKWDVTGDTLTLSPENPAEGWSVTYQRLQ